ncbi:glycosyltransferase [Massilia sp. MS-15]|uniref:glycosyltransferase n=1 Tax=Massilia sp. MS-15 TaxID=2878200 RepID=UPI001CD1C2CA|nr:glycosyltransferase [Massilia sp. MS-15]MCA1248833.1 glycosyltransferase family 4 protein [Massilia sp. MS-15]
MLEPTQRRPQVLFITPVCPGAESHSGGLQVTLERIKAMSSNADVTIAALGAAGDLAPTEGMPGVKAIYLAGEVKPRNGKTYLQSLISGLPISVWRNKSSAFMGLCRRLQQQHWDYIYADHWLVWPAAREFGSVRTILHLHNAEHLLFARAAETQRMPTKLALLLEERRVATYLRQACAEADEVHYLSSADLEEVRKIGSTKCGLVFNPSVNIEERRYGRYGGNLLFAGTLSWQPNEEGLGWFIKEVASLLPGEMELDILGGQPTAKLKMLGGKQGCQLHWQGRVPSVAPFYDAASVFVAPLLSGSGIKIKILNALSHGLPVVTTSVGIEGFPRDWHDCVHVGDTPAEFAKAILKLTRDQAAWERASAEAQSYVARHFSGAEFNQWCSELKKKDVS